MKEREEFLNVLEANKGIIFKVCNMYCQDEEDQKDLVQDVIIQLWNSYDKYDSTYKITTWVYRIALNVAISFYRKKKTKAKYTAPLDESFVNIAEEDQDEREGDLRQLKQFINELDELNKALMILYLDGNTHDEIAGILDISLSNVGTKISRIKKQLKRRFQHLKTSI